MKQNNMAETKDNSSENLQEVALTTTEANRASLVPHYTEDHKAQFHVFCGKMNIFL